MSNYYYMMDPPNDAEKHHADAEAVRPIIKSNRWPSGNTNLPQEKKYINRKISNELENTVYPHCAI